MIGRHTCEGNRVPWMTILRLLASPEERFSDQWSADPAEFGICTTLIAQALGVSQPTASRHLDLLRQAGFIIVKQHQKWSYCGRDEAAIRGYLDWLGQNLNSPCRNGKGL